MKSEEEIRTAYDSVTKWFKSVHSSLEEIPSERCTAVCAALGWVLDLDESNMNPLAKDLNLIKQSMEDNNGMEANILVIR